MEVHPVSVAREEAAKGGRSARSARRWRHHLLLGAGSLMTGAFVIVAYDRPGIREQLSLATGQVGLLLIAASLILGPLNVLRGRANPVSTDLRRDVGIWGGVLAVVHVVLGLGVHLKGKMLQYFLQPAGARGTVPLRFDPFGLANDLGLLAGVIFLLLVAISSDAALRKLGRDRWKRWQRANYFGAAATVLHGALYQVIEKRTLALVLVFAGATTLALGVQLMGFLAVRGGAGRPSR
jgi:sulfoxide reductase heme-binding subunit YedZ